MKRFFRILSIILAFFMLVLGNNFAALADNNVVILPSSLRIIDEEAFYGSKSIRKVVLSENVTEIRDRAFANSSLSEINLPDSISVIADDAFDGVDNLTVIANPGSMAYNWALKNGFIGAAIGEVSGTWGSCSWNLSEDGTLTIHQGTGVNTNGKSPWAAISTSIKSLITDGSVVLPPDSSSLFDGFVNCTTIRISSINTSEVINMHAMFRGCASTHWSMGSFDNLKVTDMSSMFENCRELDYQAFYNFNTENVVDMSRMFANCPKMTNMSSIDNLDTSHVISMAGMFYNCSNLKNLTLTSFDTSGVEDFSEMFKGCSGLTLLDISSFNTPQVLDLSQMFANCKRLLSLDLSGFNTLHVLNMTDMFKNCQDLSSITLGAHFSFKGSSMSVMTTLPEKNWCSKVDGSFYTYSYIAESRNCIEDTYSILGVDDGFYYRITDNNYCTIIGYHGDPSSFSIPERSPDGHVVNQIGDAAFYSRTDLTGTLTIPNTVTTIGKDAFFGCPGFTGNLIIPDSVQNIGAQAFCQCTGFNGILKLSSGLDRVSASSFSGCTGFTGNINIPSSVKVIETGAFSGCTGFNGNLIIPTGVKEIGSSAFYSCTHLSGDLIIPDTVSSIGESAFRMIGCNGNLHLPANLSVVPSYCFSGAHLSGPLSLPASITNIETQAFCNCAFSGSLNLPENLQHIGWGAFACCSSFSGDLLIPDSVTTIDGWAFSDCRGFNGKLILSSNISEIPECCFYRCWGLKGDIVIPEGVRSIGIFAFSDCWGFTGELKLPSSLRLIGERAFQLCNKIKGDLFIPVGVSSIGDAAFAGCKALNGTVSIPASVTTISGTPFSETEYIRFNRLTPTLSYSYSPSMISSAALSSKVSKFLLIENSYAHIHASEYALLPFELQQLTHEDASGILRTGNGWKLLWSIENSIGVDGVTPYTTLYITLSGENASDGTIFTYSETGNGYDFPWLHEEYGYSKDDFTNIILRGTPINPLYLVTNMFYAYKNVRQVTMDCIEGMGDFAFAECSSLIRVNGFDEYLHSIGNGVFKNDVKLESVDYSRSKNGGYQYDGIYIYKDPISLSSIGSEAFLNTALDSICLYSSVTYIADNAFSGLDSLTIYCEKDSYSHEYAIDHDIPYLFINLSVDSFTKSSDAWSFANDYSAFGPKGETYFLSNADREALFTHLTRSQRKLLDEKMNSEWGGSCYGMSASTVLVKMGAISPTAIQSGRNTLHSVTKSNNDSVESFINFYHLQQFLPLSQNSQISFMCLPLDEQLYRIRNTARETNRTGIPFMLAFYFTGSGGHAVVGYGYEEGQYSVLGGSYNIKIPIYDCSYPDYDSALYCNDSNLDFCVTKTNGKYDIDTFSIASNNRYLLSPVLDDSVVNDGYYPQLEFKGTDSSFSINYNGKTIPINAETTIADDGLVVTRELTGSANLMTLHFLNDVSDFTVITGARSDFVFSPGDMLYCVDAQYADSIRFDNGVVSLSGVSGDYSVDLLVDETIGNTSWFNATIEGRDNDICITKATEGLILSGESLSGLSITTTNNQRTSKIELDTSYSSVLVTESSDPNTNDAIIMVDSDNDGIYEQELSEDPYNGISLDELNFPDSFFRSYVAQTFDGNNDGYLSLEEITNAEKIDCRGCSITSLKGVEFFSNLKHLNCGNNQLTELVVDDLTNLELLACWGNSISQLNVSMLPRLQKLYCYNNNLTTVDVKSNQQLQYLSCENNPLTYLDVRSNYNLEDLECDNCGLQVLDVSANAKLKNLSCQSNNLHSLDLSNNRSLNQLFCNNNQLTELVLTYNKDLSMLGFSGNLIESIDLTNNRMLSLLFCANNRLQELDLSGLYQLCHLICDRNYLTVLDISSCPKLVSLVENNSPSSEWGVTHYSIGYSTLTYDSSVSIRKSIT